MPLFILGVGRQDNNLLRRSWEFHMSVHRAAAVEPRGFADIKQTPGESRMKHKLPTDISVS